MFRTQKRAIPWLIAGVFATGLGVFTLAGCERKERVVDVKSPVGDVEVDRNIDTGEVEVDVNRDGTK